MDCGGEFMKYTIRKQKRNSGFSMVELIIVIAIMAVLTAALAPVLIKHIEKTRRTKDVSHATTIKDGFERAEAADDITYSMPGGISTYTINPGYQPANPPQNIADAAFLELGTVPVSSTDKNYSWEIIFDATNGTVVKISLKDGSDASVNHEVYPNNTAFLENSGN